MDGETLSFPSLAPRSIDHDYDADFNKRNTVAVEIDNIRYEIGPDAYHAMPVHKSKILHSNYVQTNEYKALSVGSLRLMKTRLIDCLVVGLPVGHYHQKKDKLKKLLTGTHEFSDGYSVHVKKVLVVAQPHGGFLDCIANNDDFTKINNQVSLTLDPGFYTFDWLITNGLMPKWDRSSHFPGGISAVLDSMAKEISKDYDLDFRDIYRLDQGIRNNNFTIHGNLVDLRNYVKVATQAVETSVMEMITNIGIVDDINHVFIVGGGAHMFNKLIKKHLPNSNVIIPDQPQLSIVRGFQLLAEQVAVRSNLQAA